MYFYVAEYVCVCVCVLCMYVCVCVYIYIYIYMNMNFLKSCCHCKEVYFILLLALLLQLTFVKVFYDV